MEKSNQKSESEPEESPANSEEKKSVPGDVLKQRRRRLYQILYEADQKEIIQLPDDIIM
jgi:hypothetical protein